PVSTLFPYPTLFRSERAEVPEVAAILRARFTRDPEYAARWAQLPIGARPLENPLGGAPGFAIENVYVLPGLPSEMRAMFDVVARSEEHTSELQSPDH